MKNTKKPLPVVYGRNLSHMAYCRNWSVKETAEQLGTTEIVIHRIRQAKNVNIDAEILARAVELFECDFNSMLTPKDGLVYDT